MINATAIVIRFAITDGQILYFEVYCFRNVKNAINIPTINDRTTFAQAHNAQVFCNIEVAGCRCIFTGARNSKVDRSGGAHGAKYDNICFGRRPGATCIYGHIRIGGHDSLAQGAVAIPNVTIQLILQCRHGDGAGGLQQGNMVQVNRCVGGVGFRHHSGLSHLGQ